MRGLRCRASKACRAFCGGRRRKGSRSKEGGSGRPPFFVPPGLSGTCGRDLVAHKLARVWDLIPFSERGPKIGAHFPRSRQSALRRYLAHRKQVANSSERDNAGLEHSSCRRLPDCFKRVNSRAARRKTRRVRPVNPRFPIGLGVKLCISITCTFHEGASR